jgi:hypothetical protein
MDVPKNQAVKQKHLVVFFLGGGEEVLQNSFFLVPFFVSFTSSILISLPSLLRVCPVFNPVDRHKPEAAPPTTKTYLGKLLVKMAAQNAELEVLKWESAKEKANTRSNSVEVREVSSQLEVALSKCKILEMEVARLQAAKQAMAASLEATASLQGPH